MLFTNTWNLRSAELLTGTGSPMDQQRRLELIWSIVHQIVLAVEHMHHSGVAHCDLKVESLPRQLPCSLTRPFTQFPQPRNLSTLIQSNSLTRPCGDLSALAQPYGNPSMRMHCTLFTVLA